MKILETLSRLSDDAMSMIASCVNKVEVMIFRGGAVTMHGWNILSRAVCNRVTPVSC